MAVIANDAGAANDFNKKYFEAQATSVGLQLKMVEYVPYGNPDFSAVITKIQTESPDVIVLDLHFADPGTFFGQALNAGVDTSTIYGTDMNKPSADASQGAFDQAPYVYAGDFAPELQNPTRSPRSSGPSSRQLTAHRWMTKRPGTTRPRSCCGSSTCVSGGRRRRELRCGPAEGNHR